MNNSSAPSDNIDPALTHEAIVALKRRISALEQENTELTNKVLRTPVHSWVVREGRAIRRLVSLKDPVMDLVAEYDRRLMQAEGNDQDLEAIESSTEENRTFRSFKKLIIWCPSLKKTMQSHVELAFACQELRKGADCARGDDASTLKRSVANWLNEQHPPPYPLLLVDDKNGRGFKNDITGSLLCPIDFDWLDRATRHAIRDYNPDYAVTAHTWPSFVYGKGEYDSENPSNGLFKGELLVRAFRCIFTSPASARTEISSEENAAEPQGSRNTRKHTATMTRCDVAGLLKMRSVEPHAIAYTAVQLRFALSSSPSWTIKDDNFDYETFYHNIVDWFELPASAAKMQEIEKLLRWWNRMVFGRRGRHASTFVPQNVATLSVARSMA